MNDFFSMIFNWFSFLYDQDWDNYLYEDGLYSYFGFLTIIIAIVVAAIFYFAPTVKFNGIGKWCLFLGITFLFTFIFAYCLNDYFYNQATEEELGNSSGMDEFGISCICGLWSIVWYFLLSLLFSKFSSHNYKVPF